MKVVTSLEELSWNDLSGLYKQLCAWDDKYPVQLGHRMYLTIEEMERRMASADPEEKQRMMASIAEIV